jgi:imidazolonepropionase-like amidohydrolase
MTETDQMIAITNVTAITMAESGAVAAQTVVIEAGQIARIGPADALVVPESALRIDGTGKYLIPGLIDMHVHMVPHIALPREGADAVETSISLAGEYLRLFLAFGVTTIRNMAGSQFLLKVRDAAAAGSILAPRVLTSGPIIEQTFGWPGIATYAAKVATPEAARAEIRREVALGYDCVKIYNNIAPEIFEALLDEAHRAGLKVGGHVPVSVGLVGALAAGIDSVEHMRGFDAILDGRPFHERRPVFPDDIYPGWRFAAPGKIAELADRVAEFDAWHVPTMMVEDPEHADVVYPPVILDQLSWPVRQHLEGLRLDLDYTPQMRSDVRAVKAARREMLLELYNRGVKLLTGSDCPGAKTRLIPGHSLLSEMEAFVRSGIPPFGALQAATVNAARYLGLADEIGTIAVGKRADLVLLDADPLANISAVRRQSCVIAGGRCLPAGAGRAS